MISHPIKCVSRVGPGALPFPIEALSEVSTDAPLPHLKQRYIQEARTDRSNLWTFALAGLPLQTEKKKKTKTASVWLILIWCGVRVCGSIFAWYEVKVREYISNLPVSSM